MAFNLAKFGSSLSSVVEDAQEAEQLLSVAVDLMQMAETAGAATSATGAQKLAAVKAGLQTFVSERLPKYADSFDTLWTQLSAVVSSTVSIFNTLGVFTSAAKPLASILNAPQPAT